MRPEDSPEYCEVALPKPLLQTFTYRLGAETAGVREGMRVLVPFGRRKIVGVVDRLRERTDLERVRPVLEVLDDEPWLPPRLLALCRWIAGYYVAPLGLVVRAALPPGSLSESSFRVRLLPSGAGDDDAEGGDPTDAPAAGDGAAGTRTDRTLARGGGSALSDAEGRVLGRLESAADGLLAATLRDELDLRSVWPTLRSLRDRGLVAIEEEPPGAGATERRQQVVRITRRLPSLSAREETFGRAHRQREAYEVLESSGGEATAAHLSSQLGFSRSVLHGLAERGVAELVEETVARDPFARRDVTAAPPLDPTPEQGAVIAGLLQMAGHDAPGVALLRGVTGSGKTLVYLELLEALVGLGGRGAIVLVPEISLTPQTVDRFRARFGDAVAVLHSGLSAGERHDEWRALREGRKRIAIGARSAVFAPVRDLGVIILDEEHEGSYKQSETPRYHARAVAAVRGRSEGALCVLGSATPSLESWALAREGSYRLFELERRPTGGPLPPVELVDLREAWERGDGPAGRGGAGARGDDGDAPPGPTIFSERLRAALAGRLERGEQAILLLNRRGYATFVQCTECGKVWSCRRCNVSLTFHRRRKRVVCHHCGFETTPPARCDECGAPEPAFTGLGTEQVERRLGELFPEARVTRMDLDTTGTKWAHFDILDRMRAGEVDVLLGTQMIAKGHDFPRVTLVGVVNADVSLNLPDFRAAERTFQLLAQVAGRAGRADLPGEVLVQTFRPNHFALRTAARHDFRGFAERELEDRAGPGYPPHARLANLVLSGPEEAPVAEGAAALADWTRELLEVRRLEGVEVVGPAPCPIDRLRGRWRWHFLVRATEARPLGAVLRYVAERKGDPPGDLRLEIDRDPEALL